tara:strand:+ start:2952 stop:4094 length:1143 start_codon:yes stop_codon:yes gene_type:complete
MFTVCPKCTKQFRLYAEHIAAAAGQVRCGFCNAQFNALNHLHDEPLSNENLNRIIQSEPESDFLEYDEARLNESKDDVSGPHDDDHNEQSLEIEPEFNIPTDHGPEETSVPDNGLLNTIDEGNSEEILTGNDSTINLESGQHDEVQSEQDLIISNNAENSGLELDTAIHEIGADSATKANQVNVRDDVSTEVAPEQVETDTRESHFDFPDVDDLLTEAPIKRRWIPTLFWTCACFIGLIAIILQLVWFNRDLISVKYPQMTSYIKQVCNELDCRILRYRDTQAITLINRDVRLHPNYQDALLVNATMNNELSVRQPYPRVQLTLFDTSGALLGHRKFMPDDYLDESIDLDEGMPINIPVHFVLEVSGSTAGAVSFEFRFL